MMKKLLGWRLPPWLSVLLIAGGLVLASHREWEPLLPQHIEAPVSVEGLTLEEKIVSSTVQFLTRDRRGGASGVLFRHDNDWYCWTAAHVVRGLEQAEGDVRKAVVIARIFDQGNYDLHFQGAVLDVVAIDESLDLAVLKLLLPDFPFYEARVDDSPLRLGQEIVNCGHTFATAAPWYLSYGRIAQVPGTGEGWTGPWKEGNFLLCDVTSFPGHSGSGIWDLHGRLVGILVAGISNSRCIMFVHNDVMIRFAKDHGIGWAVGQ